MIIDHIVLREAVEAEGTVFAHVRELGLDGIVSKRAGDRLDDPALAGAVAAFEQDHDL